MKRTWIAGVLLAVAALGVLPLVAQVAPPPAPRPRASPHETVSVVISGSGMNAQRALVIYGRPYTKNPQTGQPRKIWGELVPWDKVYRLGADEATLLVTPLPLQIGSVEVPAGVVSLYLLPSENGETKLIINKMIGQWGLTYDEKQDLGRVDLKKETLSAPVDQLTIALPAQQGGGGGTLKIAWETTQFSIPFTVKK
jgi:hypothetical protein